MSLPISPGLELGVRGQRLEFDGEDERDCHREGSPLYTFRGSISETRGPFGYVKRLRKNGYLGEGYRDLRTWLEVPF